MMKNKSITKNRIGLLFVFMFSIFLCTLNKGYSQNSKYDSVLAKKLGADDYGMKKYVMAFLKTGSVTEVEKSIKDSLFAGHMKNINRLADDGKLVVAGPFFKNDKYRGLFILNVETIEDARKLVDTDPAVKSKLLDVDLLPWYGSAALQETLKIHSLIEKKGF